VAVTWTPFAAIIAQIRARRLRGETGDRNSSTESTGWRQKFGLTARFLYNALLFDDVSSRKDFSMSDNAEVNRGRRTLVIASACAGGAAAVATAVPFAASMLPSDRAKALGAPVEADIGQLAPGEKMTVEWRGQPVWILRRTPEMLADVKKDDDKVADPESKRKQDELTPVYARNEYRSIKPEYLVVVGICTHLGCTPIDKLQPGSEQFAQDWNGGFYCPCHGSLYDLAGRVYKNKPAPDNLRVPPYTFLADNRILIGDDKKGA
jgi:ubiquinol-cytochrome c reductase iron-sulfur subunit